MANILDLLLQFIKNFSPLGGNMTRMCKRCRALEGEVMCDRSLYGEIGACDFRTLKPCQQCGSGVPCYGLPCELSDRLSRLRKDFFKEEQKEPPHAKTQERP